MKKLVFLLILAIVLTFLASCKEDPSVESEIKTCEELGGHELVYCSSENSHWRRCAREECEYITSASHHYGGTATCAVRAACDVCGAHYGEYATKHNNYVSVIDGCSVYDECTECKTRAITGENHTIGSDGLTCAVCGIDYFTEVLTFTLNEDKASYTLSDGVNQRTERLIIPSEYNGLPVTKIGEGAFSGNAFVKEAVLPDTIKVIEPCAFDMSTLEKINFPDSVEEIGAIAFCSTNLKSVVLGTGIKKIDIEAFALSDISEVIIPGSVEIQMDSVFSYCENLERVVFGNGFKNIPEKTFEGCINLREVILPDTVESIGADAFKDCENLNCSVFEGVKYLGVQDNPYYAAVEYIGGSAFTAHESAVLIAANILFNVEGVKEISLGASVRFIGEKAFGGMDALEEISVSSDNPYYYSKGNILFNGVLDTPIYVCRTSVIPSDGSLKEVNLNMFNYISTIETIYIPKGVETLIVEFQGLASLKSIIIESDVKNIISKGSYNLCNSMSTGEKCMSVYFCHTKDEFDIITITDDKTQWIFKLVDCFLDHSVWYVYSENEPNASGNFWHYEEGEIESW